jgi:hypothetical protein
MAKLGEPLTSEEISEKVVELAHVLVGLRLDDALTVVTLLLVDIALKGGVGDEEVSRNVMDALRRIRAQAEGFS